MNPHTVILRCQCGKIHGQAGPLSRFWNKRIVCMCADCQAFAYYLGQEDRMLDTEGGSELIPIHPAYLQFTKGRENLACVRLSDDGLRRWYASCCRTPVANTHPRNHLPLASVHRSLMMGEIPLGPISARLYGRQREWLGLIRTILHALLFLAKGYGLRLNRPWPFPDVKPSVGSDTEYYALIAKVKSRNGEHIFSDVLPKP